MKKNLVVVLSILFLSFALICGVQSPALAETTTTFSFASDTYHQGHTFKGEQNNIFSDSEIDLMVDLNSDTYGGLVTYHSRMRLTAQTGIYQVYAVGPQYLHVWKVSGEIVFTHINATAGNPPILTITFKEAVLTSWSPNPTTIGETMTLQDSESADESIAMTAHTLLTGIGVKPEFLTQSEDFAFTFTHVRSASGGSPFALIKVDKAGNLMEPWVAEGSFSASAYFPN
jgi:hypothetical protein